MQNVQNTQAPHNERVGVGKFLKNSLKQSLEIFKHPLKLLPTLVIGVVWLVIGYFSSKMELPLWAKIVSFFTFAEGGLFGGALGAVGGIVGKVVMAVFINSLILPLFEKKLPFVGVAGGIKGMFANIGKDSSRGVAPVIGGMGAALLIYSFMNISQIWLNSMVGIAATVMLLQNIGNQGGFLFGLLFSLANSLTKGRVPRFITITRTLTGMTVGFTVATGLSAAKISLYSLLVPLVGAALLTLALLLSLFLNKKKKEQPATPATDPIPAVQVPAQPYAPQQRVPSPSAQSVPNVPQPSYPAPQGRPMPNAPAPRVPNVPSHPA